MTEEQESKRIKWGTIIPTFVSTTTLGWLAWEHYESLLVSLVIQALVVVYGVTMFHQGVKAGIQVSQDAFLEAYREVTLSKQEK